MLRASETHFKEPLNLAVRYQQGYVVSDKRTYWWTHHILESSPSTSLPAPDTLIYNDDHILYDTPRFILDLSYETLLGRGIQLEPIDLSLKKVPELKQRMVQSSEFLRMLLSSDNSTKSTEIEIIPISADEENKRKVEVSQNNHRGKYDKRTSSSYSSFTTGLTQMQAICNSNNTIPLQACDETIYSWKSTENVTRESALAMNAAKKARTRRLPPPPPEPTSVLSRPRVFPNPKSKVGLLQVLEQNDRRNEISSHQLETLSETVRSERLQMRSQENRGPGSSRGMVDPHVAQGNFVNPATIRRPPMKRKSNDNSSDTTMTPFAPVHASNGKVVPRSYRESGTQARARALTSPLHSTSAGGQSPSSHLMSLLSYIGSNGEAIPPELALRSYPSISSAATPPTAATASQAHPRSNMSRQPYPQSTAIPSRTFPVLTSPATSPSLDIAKTTRYPGVQQGWQPTHRNVSAGRDAKSGSTFSVEDFECAYAALHERWLRKQFASVIENPEPPRKRRKTPWPKEASKNSRQSTKRKDGGTRSNNSSGTLCSADIDWAKASTSYQQAVCERSPAMNTNKPETIPWNLLFSTGKSA